MNINDKTYTYFITYNQIKQNNTILQYLVNIQPYNPMGIMKTNGGAAYSVPEGNEIGSSAGYFSEPLPLLQTSGGGNQAANTIELGQDFYLGFNTENGSPYSSFGWLKMNITNDKITIISYGYRIGKPITAGEN
jgi:hypothetical protein